MQLDRNESAISLSQLAIHTITTKPWSLPVAAERYAAAGVGGICIWVEALEGMTTEQASRAVRDAGLRVPALVRGGFFCDADKNERAQRIDHNRRLIETAGELSAEMMVLVVGAVPDMPLDQQRGWVRDAIEALIDDANAANVKLAIEPLHPMYSADKSCINQIAQARQMCEAIGHPQVGVAVDVYHVWWDEELESEVRRLGRSNSLFGFHLCDWRTPTRDLLNDRALMGDGCIDLARISGLIKEAGFTGWHEVEIFSDEHWARDQDRYLAEIIQRYESLRSST